MSEPSDDRPRPTSPCRHGHCRGGKPTPEYRIWASMLQRCNNPRCKLYPLYGGRGIAVCDRWQGDGGFLHFIADVGPQPFRRAGLDRLDNDGPYAGWNVAWADQRAQTRNMRSNRVLTHGGRSMILTDWAAELGVRPVTLAQRLRRGWSHERALTTPVEARKPFKDWVRRNPDPKRPGRRPKAKAADGAGA